MRSESWLRLMSSMVLLGVFSAGIVTGIGLMRWSAAPAERSHRPPGPPGPFEAMERELALDAEQTAGLRTIAAAHDEELTRIGRTAQASVRDILHSIEEQLRPRLRPDQIEKLERWRARRPRMIPGLPGSPLGPRPGGP
jgi:hypothetical protein